MPGCAAVNCSNSAKKRFLMKRFPRDRARRKEWFIKMRRDNWKPTDYSCLCEVHFAPEMWEKTREDGTKKLKTNAVPSIFSFSLPRSKRKAPVQRKPLPPKKTKHLFGQATSAVQIMTEDMEVTIAGNLGAQPTTSSGDLPESQESSTSNSTFSEDNKHGISPLSHEEGNSKSVELMARLNRLN